MLQSSICWRCSCATESDANPPRPSWGHIFGTALPRFGGRFPAAVGVSEAKQEQASTDEDPVRSWATAWFSQGDCSLSYSGVKNCPWSCAIQINLAFSNLCNPRSDILGCAELTTPSRWRFCKVSPSWCKPLGKSPCWGPSSPLPKKSRTRLPFFGLVLASGLSLLCCVGTVSIPPFFLCSLTLPGLELEQHLRMLLWTLATSWPTWVWHLGLNLVWQVSPESPSFRSWWFDSLPFNGKRHCCKVLVAMLRLRTASEGWGNFGEDLTLQFRN